MCIKGHYQSETTTHRVGEKCANHISNKGLISRIYKKTPVTQQQKPPKQPNSQMGKRLEWTFLQRRYASEQQAHGRALNITHFKEMQPEITTRCHPLGWLFKKKKRTMDENAERTEPSCPAGRNVNGTVITERSVAAPQRTKHRIIIQSSNSTPRYPLRKGGQSRTWTDTRVSVSVRSSVSHGIQEAPPSVHFQARRWTGRGTSLSCKRNELSRCSVWTL